MRRARSYLGSGGEGGHHDQKTKLRSVGRQDCASDTAGSQDVATRTGAVGGDSARHLGFVELGRAKPSLDILERLLDALDVMPAERAYVLQRAGMERSETTLEQTYLAQRNALLSLTRQYSGIPLVAFDHTWTSICVNREGIGLARYLMSGFDWHGVTHSGTGLDMIGATAHQGGLLSKARQPERVAAILLRRFAADRWSEPDTNGRVEQCSDTLRHRFGSDVARSQVDPFASIEMIFDTDDGPLHFSSMQVLPAAPQDVFQKMPRLDIWMPFDAPTHRFLARMLEKNL